MDGVAELDLRQVKVNERGSGSEQYPPSMLMALIIHSCTSGVFGSRRIEQLVPTVAAIPQRVRGVEAVLIDSGFYSEAAVKEVESVEGGESSGTKVYAAVEKSSHHRAVEDLEKKPEPEAPTPEAPVSQENRRSRFSM